MRVVMHTIIRVRRARPAGGPDREASAAVGTHSLAIESASRTCWAVPERGCFPSVRVTSAESRGGRGASGSKRSSCERRMMMATCMRAQRLALAASTSTCEVPRCREQQGTLQRSRWICSKTTSSGLSTVCGVSIVVIMCARALTSVGSHDSVVQDMRADRVPTHLTHVVTRFAAAHEHEVRIAAGCRMEWGCTETQL